MNYFIFSLFITFIIIRLWAHLGHDRKNYGSTSEKSRTLTFWLRKRTGFDWHHIHLGFVMLIFGLIYAQINGLNNNINIIFGISLSMIADQILPFFKFGNYFSKKMIFGALIIHVILAIISTKIFR